MKSTTYAIIFIDSIDAVRIFKLLNFTILQKSFRFLNSFSGGLSYFEYVSHRVKMVRSDSPRLSFQVHFKNFFF